MVKVHKLVAAIATTITLSTTGVYALNMGEISWRSSYGQPLNARIELTDAAGLRAADIRPSLASHDDFARLGLDRTSELSNLTFRTVLGNDGKGYIQVTSAQPIKEPYLNFLLDVDWQGNKITREYTILMDFPSSTPPAPVATVATKQVTTTTVTTKPAPVRPAPQPVITAETYRTVRGDTLWSVAEKVSSHASAAKTATAIYKKNPKAFINGNANQLLADYTLRLPTGSEANAVSTAEATALLQSNRLPSTTTSSSTTATTPTTTAPVDSTQSNQLQTQLESSKQQLDSARQENDELSTQLEQLQAEINRLEELSKQKDSQIAEVKSQISQPATDVPPVVDTQEPLSEQQRIAEQEAAEQQRLYEQQRAEEQAAEEQQRLEEQRAAEQQAAEEQRRLEQQQANEQQQATDSNATAQPTQSNVQQQQNDVVESSPSFISSLLGNRMLLIAGGGVLLLICLVAILLRRRKAAGDDDATVVDLSNVTLDDDDLNDPATVEAAATDTTSSTTSPLSQLGEGMGIIDKADIYLAYNHYDEAKDLLTNALQDDPTNTEYRLKLMEVYAEKGDIDNFESEEQELILLDPLAQHKIDSLKEKYPTLASSQFNYTPTAQHVEETAPFTGFDEPVTDAPTTTTETVAEETDPSEVSFDFDTFPSATPEETPAVTEETTPTEEPEVIYEPDPTRLVDDSFELDKVSADEEEIQSPMFGGHPAEEDFSPESPVFDFDKEEEVKEEPKEEDFKFDLGFADNAPVVEEPLATTDIVSQETADEIDDVIEKDQVTTKLELVHAYIDMGDTEGAHDLLEEIIREGNENQRAEAQSLLASMGTSSFDAPATNDSVQPTENRDEQPLISLSDDAAKKDTSTSMTELDLGFELPPEDEVSTKLELAAAYIEMGDSSGAKDILEEVLKEGTAEQKQQAEQLLASMN